MAKHSMHFFSKFRLFCRIDFLIASLIQSLLKLILKTCTIHITGLEHFLKCAGKEPCILALWHNRLAPALFILDRYTPKNIDYLAVVSASRDGKILEKIISSYKNGHTLLVPHSSRFEALKKLIEEVQKPHQVIVITPDGPRGPCYRVKPGIILAAKAAKAPIFYLDWKASHMWQLKSWDRFRLPKPFSTLTVHFSAPIRLEATTHLSLEEEMKRLEVEFKIDAEDYN